MPEEVNQSPNLLIQKITELWSLTLVLKCYVEFLCTCTSMSACVRMHECVPVGEEERENILSSPPEQFRRSYLLVHLANMLKWIEETYLGCICRFQIAVFFWRRVFIISMNILPQQCKESAQPQPRINIFWCIFIPCVYCHVYTKNVGTGNCDWLKISKIRNSIASIFIVESMVNRKTLMKKVLEQNITFK